MTLLIILITASALAIGFVGAKQESEQKQKAQTTRDSLLIEIVRSQERMRCDSIQRTRKDTIH